LTDFSNLSAGPLAGIRILDMTSVMLGPYATQMLGDYGADIIKVESPGGDTTRVTGPSLEPGMAATFIGANRSKRSVVLDLKHAAGRDALLSLVDHVDVLISSVRPQKLAALGLAPATLMQRNSKLIVVSVHGFGEDGPYAGRPAYDDIIQGLCGLASLGEAEGAEPRYMPTVMADKTCALFATQAVLAAIVARSRTGCGSQVEVPMLESMVNFTLVEHFYGAHFRPPLSEPGYSRLLTKWRRPYRTLDGHVCVVPYSDQHWVRFFEEAGRPELLTDERFSGLAARTRNIDALYAELAACIATRSTEDWLSTCDRLDIPAAPLRRLKDLETDPHLVATGFFQQSHDPLLGTLVMPRAPLKFDGAFASPGRLPPRLGQHTREVLAEAGLNEERIEELIRCGAAAQSNISLRPKTQNEL
jgi:crotonobetainyl-CoA:carnitine CoA-transferase CaiB-like acyl-CoA transferase